MRPAPTLRLLAAVLFGGALTCGALTCGAAPVASVDGKPAFDMEAARSTVRAMVRNGELGRPLPSPEPPNRYSAQSVLRTDRDVQLGRAIEGARRADCRTAYAGAGLLAVIPILYDMARDAGCKW